MICNNCWTNKYEFINCGTYFKVRNRESGNWLMRIGQKWGWDVNICYAFNSIADAEKVLKTLNESSYINICQASPTMTTESRYDFGSSPSNFYIRVKDKLTNCWLNRTSAGAWYFDPKLWYCFLNQNEAKTALEYATTGKCSYCPDNDIKGCQNVWRQEVLTAIRGTEQIEILKAENDKLKAKLKEIHDRSA
jgi:hypothetical protein